MSKWSEIAKYFEENSHSKIYFESQSSAKALKQIQTIVKNHFPQMIFLLGEPGTGKTFLLNHIANHYKDEKFCLMMENPFLTPQELLRRMLTFVGVDPKDKDVESMRLEAIKAYENRPHIVMIDEAQLSHAPLREFIRILSDSKVFWFLIAMHTKEGESLLKNPHFFSRAHQVIYMGSLDKDEFSPYIKQVLKDSNHLDTIINIENFLINGIEKYAKGNFRNFKKLCYEFFLLLDYAYNNDRIDYTKPSPKLLEMAAIKAGLTNAKRETEFDKLIIATNTKIIKKDLPFVKMVSIFVILILLAILGWFLKDIFTNKSSKVVNPKPTKIIEKEQKEQKQLVPKKESIVIVHEKINTQNSDIKKEDIPKLTFYPPNIDKIHSKKSKKIQNHTVTTMDYEESLNVEPIFLDSKVKRNRPILKVSKSKSKGLKYLITKYNSSPDYKLALDIANIYYDQKDFKNSSIWANKANGLDRQKEEPWILFAKSNYKLGKRKDAINSLKLFLDYKFSQRAKNLLDKWSKDN